MGFHQSVSAVSARDLTLSVGVRDLIRDACFGLRAGTCTALVGRNGGGKSSLLGVVDAAIRQAGAPAHLQVRGSISVRAGTAVAYVPQIPREPRPGATVADHIDAHAGGLAALHRRHEQLLEAGSADSDISDVVDRLSLLGGWDYPERRTRVLHGVGLSESDLSRPMRTLSGGEAVRVALAAALAGDADVLLLDEPSNNLDRDARAFLLDAVRDSAGAVLVVSHDRDFLDAVTDEVLDIDEEHATVRVFGGTYTESVAAKRRDFEGRIRQYEEQVEHRQALLASAAALSANGQRFQSLSQNDYFRARGQKVARRAVVQLRRIERELSDLEEPQLPKRPRIDVPHVVPLHATLLRARSLSAGHLRERPLIQDLDLTLRDGERIAITGANGSGKTTLLRTLIGEILPLAGSVEHAVHLRIGNLTQVPRRGAERTVVDIARERTCMSEEDAGAMLGKVLFGDVSGRSTGSLSAGELRRVELAVLFASRPQLVVLDEPTNHMDLLTIEMLEEALEAYTGALIVVSHDQRFIDGCRPRHTIALGD